MKNIFCFLCMLLFSFGINAQKKYPELVDSIDYVKSEPQVLKAIDWYLRTSLRFEPREREQVGQFCFQWMTGSPTVTIDIDEKVVGFMETSPQLLMPFLMGWTKYSLENDHSKDKIKCCIAAIRATTHFYDHNISSFKKDKVIENYKKMSDEELEQFLKTTSFIKGSE